MTYATPSPRRRLTLLKQRLQRRMHGPPLREDMKSDSRTLLISFGGMTGQMDMPPFEFQRVTEEIPVKRLFVRDLRQAWYHEGVPGLGSTLVETIEALRNRVAQYDVDRVVTMGSSMGGYAALVFGTQLQADAVLSFGPQTVLDVPALLEAGDERWVERLGEVEAAGDLNRSWSDLRQALIGAPLPGREAVTRCEIYFGQLGHDRWHAERLRGLEGVRLYRFGRGGHSTARMLRQSGALDRVLRRALQPDLVLPRPE